MPFTVIGKPHTFKTDGTFTKGIVEDIEQPQLYNAKVQGKHILEVDRHQHINYKNAPATKSYGIKSTLTTGNPSAHSSEMVPFDLLTKNGKVHEKLWEYWLKKGPNVLPSNMKLVEKNCQWVPLLFQQVYKAQKSKQ